MKKAEMNINGKKTVFYHNTSEDIAGLFQETLRKEDETYNIIDDNKIIQIGFTFYKIQKINNEFQIFAVDYTKDPFADFTDDLTLALNIMNNQLIVTRKTGMVSDQTISFQDTILAKKSALRSENVYFEKQDEKNNNDSGWYLGSLEDSDQSDDPEDYTMIRAYQLLGICPAGISVLNLPAGSMAVIKNNEIAGICDAENNEVYNI